MHIGRFNPDEDFQYCLLGNTLELVNEEKDIGVTIDSEL
jgi:hypothetical protein